MARLRMDGVADDALIPTPPAGKATIFYNSTDRIYKAKLDDGTVVTMSADAEGPVTSVNGQTGVVTLNKSDIGLANVDNTSDANKPISNATQLALNAKYDASNPANYVDAAAAAAAAPVQSVAGQTGIVTLSKSDVGLANVDNTSDANKPVSNATQLALDELGGRVFTVESEVVGLDSAVSGLDSRVTTLEGSVSTLQSDVSSIQGEVSTIEGAISSLETSVAGKLSLTGGTMTGNINMESSGGGSGPVTLFGMFLGNSGGLSTYAFTPAAPNAMDAPFQLFDGMDNLLGDITFNPSIPELEYTAAPGSSIPDITAINTIPIFAELTGTGIIYLEILFSDTYMPMMPVKLQYVGAGAATNYKVVGLADAVNARDAVNKQQLDAAISSVSGPVDLATQVTGVLPAANGGTGITEFPAMQLLFGSPDNQFIDRSEFFTYDASIGLLLNVGGQMQTRSLAQDPADPSAVVIYDKVEVTGDDGTGPAYSRLKRDYVEAKKVLATKELSASLGFDGVNSWLGVSETTNAGNNISMAKIFPNKAQLFTVDVGIGNGPQPILPVEPYDLTTKKYVDDAVAGAGGAVSSVNGQTGDVVLVKADVGLGNVDNTADLDKPISTATQSALDDLTIATQDNASSLDDLTVYAQDIRNDLDLFVTPSGATRPASPVVGQMFFDTVLVKPIWYSGSAWVDATGTAV